MCGDVILLSIVFFVFFSAAILCITMYFVFFVCLFFVFFLSFFSVFLSLLVCQFLFIFWWPALMGFGLYW